MKQPKKLTRDQKIVVSAHYLNPEEWMLQKESEFYLTLVHKKTGKTKRIDKFYKGKQRR